jgi:hypothetical protein
MSKQCFTNGTLERFQGTINRLKRQHLIVSERGKENGQDISQLIQHLFVIDSRVERSGESLRRGRKTLNEKSTGEFVRDALARARRPLTILEIGSRIKQLGWTTTSMPSEYMTIARAVNREIGKLFRRVDRGKFILIRR